MTRKNWSDAYDSLNVDVKYILMECAACFCAIKVIQWDMSGYTSLAEAQTMINVLWATAMQDIKVLEDKNSTQTFMVGA